LVAAAVVVVLRVPPQVVAEAEPEDFRRVGRKLSERLRLALAGLVGHFPSVVLEVFRNLVESLPVVEVAVLR
jgi:hypothetical protein